MGIVFKKDETVIKSHEELQREHEALQRENAQLKAKVTHPQGVGTSGTSGTAGGSNYGTQDWHTDDAYYKQIIWNMGQELDTLRNENKELKAQIQSITKLLM